MSPARRRPKRAPQRPRLSWSDARTRGIFWQAVVVAIAVVIVAMIARQTAANLRVRGIASGYGYLERAAGFELPPGPLPYSSRDTYLHALGLALFNTLRVSVLGVMLATVLGVLIGVLRLSNIWVVSATSKLYVELVRNTPLLLQLLFWYALSQALPLTRDALHPLPGVFLTNRGLFLPGIGWQSAFEGAGARLAIVNPVLTGFNFHGGFSISPEFAALVIGVSTYTAAFIAEIVRGGILAVDRGQAEAAKALGLSRRRILQLVVLPQALRVIVPPTTSQFLNLLKNSSLAVAIGYPGLIAITSTTLNQTGQAIEAISLVALIYLAISLAGSLAMNAYNGTVDLREYGKQAA